MSTAAVVRKPYSPPRGYVPMRLFLDSNTQQALVDHGGTVYEREPFVPWGRSGASEEDVEALQGIFLVAERAHFEFVASENSMREAAASRDVSYSRFCTEVRAHFADCMTCATTPFDGGGQERVRPLDEGRCGYLSVADARLVRDAVLLECDTFLTIERRLTRTAPHLSRTLGIQALRPPELWAVLQPHLAAV